ncbi:MAG: hypothetical protein ABR907_12310 [Terracidiphilus sp.]
MKKVFAIFAMMLAVLLILPTIAGAQAQQKATIFAVAGHAGEIQIVQINGKSYVEIESLARLTQGTLSFKGNRTTLALPSANAEAPAAAPHPKSALSAAFIRAGIEEMSLIGEWRTAIVNAVQSNNPIPEDFISAHHRQAEKDLALASAAISTDDDRSAMPLLTAEFNNMQKLSDSYLALRKQSAFISPDTFNNGSLEDQIQDCSRAFTSMTETHEFQDQSACH